ncbi:transposase family protein [Streptomyces cellostaticus]|uniref:transposase family protein n=1 Tax=Streptomyces cellostaticus TaxID=67285 RepID=UPI001FC93DFD|nr:transposase family protein [Streptomyces cellostaticus]
MAACAVLAGAKSPTAIAEWAADTSERLLSGCGAALCDSGCGGRQVPARRDPRRRPLRPPRLRPA